MLLLKQEHVLYYPVGCCFRRLSRKEQKFCKIHKIRLQFVRSIIFLHPYQVVLFRTDCKEHNLRLQSTSKSIDRENLEYWQLNLFGLRFDLVAPAVERH